MAHAYINTNQINVMDGSWSVSRSKSRERAPLVSGFVGLAQSVLSRHTTAASFHHLASPPEAISGERKCASLSIASVCLLH